MNCDFEICFLFLKPTRSSRNLLFYSICIYLFILPHFTQYEAREPLKLESSVENDNDV